MILILTQDLMMSSSASAVARSLNIPFKSSASTSKSIQRLNQGEVTLLLIDLQLPGLDITKICEDLKSLATDVRPHCVAYAPHVEVDLLKSAREAGIDEVYTRGQMNGGLDALFAQHASA